MIYSMSEKYGVELIRLYMPILPDDVEARIAGMRILAELFGQRGWGKLTFEEMDIEGGTISALIESHPARDRIEDCMGPKEAPLCIFLRGAIAGLLSSVLEKDLSVRAVDCSLKDQNICRYIFDVS